MKRLPDLIVLPTPENWVFEVSSSDGFHREFFQYFLNTAIYAGVKIEYDNKLKAISNQVIPFIVDNVKCLYSISDFSIAPTAAWSGAHQVCFMLHHLPIFKPYSNLASFPPQSFFNWDEYYSLSKTEYTCATDLIIHSQIIESVRRRVIARKALLNKNYNLQLQVVPKKDYWKMAQNCCASVHIPGGTEHIMDRAQLQLIGLGVCTISTDIFCSLCDFRAEPNVHYVCIRDDLSDLTEKVDWCLSHRKECIEIGKNAKKLFEKACTPHVIWSHVKNKIAKYEPIKMI